jgi:CspA family cold shock protein
MHGSVKWFDDRRGYGFILPQEGGRQVFVHQSAIASSGFRTLLQGQEVRFDLVASERGVTASNVVVLKEGVAEWARRSRDWFGEKFSSKTRDARRG